jgi:hypothetical protein
MPAKAGIQYAAASRFIFAVSGILDHPRSRMMTPSFLRDQIALFCAIRSQLTPP